MSKEFSFEQPQSNYEKLNMSRKTSALNKDVQYTTHVRLFCWFELYFLKPALLDGRSSQARRLENVSRERFDNFLEKCKSKPPSFMKKNFDKRSAEFRQMMVQFWEECCAPTLPFYLEATQSGEIRMISKVNSFDDLNRDILGHFEECNDIEYQHLHELRYNSLLRYGEGVQGIVYGNFQYINHACNAKNGIQYGRKLVWAVHSDAKIDEAEARLSAHKTHEESQKAAASSTSTGASATSGSRKRTVSELELAAPNTVGESSESAPKKPPQQVNKFIFDMKPLASKSVKENTEVLMMYSQDRKDFGFTCTCNKRECQVILAEHKRTGADAKDAEEYREHFHQIWKANKERKQLTKKNNLDRISAEELNAAEQPRQLRSTNRSGEKSDSTCNDAVVQQNDISVKDVGGNGSDDCDSGSASNER